MSLTARSDDVRTIRAALDHDVPPYRDRTVRFVDRNGMENRIELCCRVLYSVLRGQGCFGECLNRIGREATAQYHHYGSDSAQHSLKDYSA